MPFSVEIFLVAAAADPFYPFILETDLGVETDSQLILGFGVYAPLPPLVPSPNRVYSCLVDLAHFTLRPPSAHKECNSPAQLNLFFTLVSACQPQPQGAMRSIAAGLPSW